MKYCGLILLILSFGVYASINVYSFDDQNQEQQFGELIKELRCPTCQNQTISDSDAPLAKDLKDKTYQMVIDGNSKEQIIEYMTDRYGYFVNYQPPVKSSTYFLWFAPFVFLFFAVAIFVVRNKNKSNQRKIELSEEEKENLKDILQGDK